MKEAIVEQGIKMKKTFTTTLGILGLFCLCAIFGRSESPKATVVPYPVEEFSGDVAYRVLRVIDGDTVEIDYEGKTTAVRLIGVDTPETVHPNQPVEPYGKEASNFTKNLLMGESVYLRFDVDRTDKYDRLLAYLYRVPDGLFVNLEIVRQGYGHAYIRFPFKHSELFQHYAEKASEVGKGVHGGVPKSPIMPKNELVVYVTGTGKKYHLEECRWGTIPMPLEEAKLRYEPCRICKPLSKMQK